MGGGPSRCIIVVRRDARSLPNGIRRRVEHLVDHCEATGRSVKTVTLAEFARQFHRLLWERHSRPDEVQIFFVALLQPTMARAGVIFALLGLRVIVDVCDSINLLGTALSGHIGLQQTVRKMSSSLKMAPRRMHISYISERDAAADAGFDFGCKVAVVGPTAPRDILILANSSIGQIERFAISGDYRSEHTARP